MSFLRNSNTSAGFFSINILSLTGLLVCFPIFLFSQQKNLPLNRDFEFKLRHSEGKCFEIGKIDTTEPSQIILSCPEIIHSGFKPILLSANDHKDYKASHYSLFFRKIKKENLFIINDTTDKFHLTIDPLFNFEYGKDLANDSSKYFYKNSTSNLFPNPTNYPYNVVPGQGRAKTFKKNGYDFAMASGYVSYSPNRHFNFQLGTGKHFIGDGYRSLLRSDNAFNSPFVRITSSFGKFN